MKGSVRVCRAKFITGSVAMLLAKPGGGREWLLNLRTVPYRDASEALCKLPGIGPKVSIHLQHLLQTAQLIFYQLR